MSTPAAHAADVWVKCAGSVAMRGAFPDLQPDSPERVEGREWHSAGEALLRDGELTGTPAMQEGAQLWVDTLTALAPLDAWRVEERIPLDKLVHPDIPPGRPDAWCYHEGVLRVADYKAGHGYVSEWENWQALLYLSGLVRMLQADGTIPDTPEAEQHLRLSVTIVQPRYYGRHGQVRTRNIPGNQLRAYTNVLINQAGLSRRGDAPTVTGSHCNKCDGRRGCSALQEAGLRSVDVAHAMRIVEPTAALVGHELQELHAAQQILKARTDALEEQALHYLANGQSVAGYEMGETQSREGWKPGMAEQVLQLGQLLGADLSKPAEPVTPAQARKKGIDASVINQYCHRPAGARKLMPADSTITQRIFNNG